MQNVEAKENKPECKYVPGMGQRKKRKRAIKIPNQKEKESRGGREKV